MANLYVCQIQGNQGEPLIIALEPPEEWQMVMSSTEIRDLDLEVRRSKQLPVPQVSTQSWIFSELGFMAEEFEHLTSAVLK